MLERKHADKGVLPPGISGLVEAECVKSNVGAWPEKILLGRVEGGGLRGLSEKEEDRAWEAMEAAKDAKRKKREQPAKEAKATTKKAKATTETGTWEP
jgi:hypothetical protein